MGYLRPQPEPEHLKRRFARNDRLACRKSSEFSISGYAPEVSLAAGALTRARHWHVHQHEGVDDLAGASAETLIRGEGKARSRNRTP